MTKKIAKKKTEKKEKKKTNKQVLLANAEQVIEMIRAAKTYDEITRTFKVRREDLSWFIAESDYSARAINAQRESADTYAAKAEEVLLEIEPTFTQASVTRQRELAHHYRWQAAKKNPRGYGDSTRVQAEVKDTSSTSSWLGDVLDSIDKNK